MAFTLTIAPLARAKMVPGELFSMDIIVKSDPTDPVLTGAFTILTVEGINITSVNDQPPTVDSSSTKIVFSDVGAKQTTLTQTVYCYLKADATLSTAVTIRTSVLKTGDGATQLAPQVASPPVITLQLIDRKNIFTMPSFGSDMIRQVSPNDTMSPSLDTNDKYTAILECTMVYKDPSNPSSAPIPLANWALDWAITSNSGQFADMNIYTTPTQTVPTKPRLEKSGLIRTLTNTDGVATLYICSKTVMFSAEFSIDSTSYLSKAADTVVFIDFNASLTSTLNAPQLLGSNVGGQYTFTGASTDTATVEFSETVSINDILYLFNNQKYIAATWQKSLAPEFSPCQLPYNDIVSDDGPDIDDSNDLVYAKVNNGVVFMSKILNFDALVDITSDGSDVPGNEIYQKAIINNDPTINLINLNTIKNGLSICIPTPLLAQSGGVSGIAGDAISTRIYINAFTQSGDKNNKLITTPEYTLKPTDVNPNPYFIIKIPKSELLGFDSASDGSAGRITIQYLINSSLNGKTSTSKILAMGIDTLAPSN